MWMKLRLCAQHAEPADMYVWYVAPRNLPCDYVRKPGSVNTSMMGSGKDVQCLKRTDVISSRLHINPKRAQAEQHLRGGYSRGYPVALLASSSGIANKQELFTGITCEVVRKETSQEGIVGHPRPKIYVGAPGK
jgi:hypothetical protein